MTPSTPPVTTTRRRRTAIAIGLAAVVAATLPLGGAPATAATTFEFATPVLGGTTASYPRVLVDGDFDGDGDPDLASVNYTSPGEVAVNLGNGDGTYTSETVGTAGSLPWHLDAADVDGDGRDELVTADYGSGSLSYLDRRSDGSGWDVEGLDLLGSGVCGVGFGDFTGDGRLDIAAVNWSSGELEILPQLAGGGFGPAEAKGAAGRGWESTVADVDGDGDPDVVMANDGENTVTVRLLQADGSFDDTDLPVAGSPYTVVTGNLDSDAGQEVVATNRGAGTVSIIDHDGGAWTTTTSPVQSDPSSGEPRAVVADLDGDGTGEIVVDGSTSLTVLDGSGTTWTIATTIPTDDVTPLGLAATDLDGDDDVDLVASDGSGGGQLLTVLNGTDQTRRRSTSWPR